MKENKKVSIIIPIYNNEKLLRKCVDSIINQTYKNLEIILVDDGSTDNSGKISDEYKKNDERVKVIHKKNGGLSSARNAGLEICKGKFISFVDSDDYVSAHYIEYLLKSLISSNSDLSVCSYEKVYDKNFCNDNITFNNLILTKEEAFEEMVINDKFAGYVWNKLYKKEIIDGMKEKFMEYMVEDFEFNARYINNCSKISIVNTPLYYYFTNYYGITGSFNINKRILHGVDAYDSIQMQYDMNKIKYSDLVAYYYLKYELNVNYRIKKLKYNVDCRVLDYSLFKRVISSKVIGIKKKIEIFILWHLPYLLYEIKYFIKGGKK